MRLLSRNAEALFWLARYLERASSLARVIEMQSAFGNLDRDNGWTWLLALLNDEADFKKKFEVSAANIVTFYMADLTNGGSIRSSIHWARENARALRPFIPLEMWVQLNAFHTNIEQLGAHDIEPAQLPRTCAIIRSGCLAQIGIAEGTLFRDEGYQFYKLGLLIERADQTSRLLDVKFAQGTSLRPADPSDDFVFWSTILRTAAAYQVFHRLEAGHASPDRVARFLINNLGHPRSIGFCVQGMSDSLNILRSAFRLPKASAALECCEVLQDGLQAVPGDAELIAHLHTFNDWVQQHLIVLTEHVATAFFRPAPRDVAATVKPDDAPPLGQSPAQSQSQSQTQKQT